jgi:hypothetical protein
MSEGNWFEPFSETELLGVKSRAAIPDSEVPYYFHRLLATVDAAEQRGRDSADNPELDATDHAHPAWWRGHDAGAVAAFKKLEAATAREAALREALEIAAEDVCGLHCISHWRTEDYPGGRPPHSGICETINKALDIAREGG